MKRRRKQAPFHAPLEWVVLAFFFLSGFAGLVDEVVWNRLLSFVFGNSVLSLTTVLTTFMGGLALGSYLAGRYPFEKYSPVMLYGLLEGAIGLFVITLPVVIPATTALLRPFYPDSGGSTLLLNVSRFLIGGLILLVPTTFMGATLPILTRYVAQTRSLGSKVGRLYAINSAGAVLGALAGTFILMPSLGLSRTLYAAAGVNLIIALFILFSRKFFEGTQAREEPVKESGTASTSTRGPSRASISPTLLLVGYGAAGAAALATQIGWTRIVSLTLGSSVYAFALIVAGFIAGISAGSAVASRFADRVGLPVRWLASFQALIAFTVLAAIPFLGKIPIYFIKHLEPLQDRFWLFQGAEFALILAVVFIPTFFMGASFPFATRSYVSPGKSPGKAVGNVYAANTVGAILGALLGGFVLIPLLGIQRTLFCAASLYAVVACIFLIPGPLPRLRRNLAAAGVAVAVTLTVILLPPWDKNIISSGGYLYADYYQQLATDRRTTLEAVLKKSERVLFHREGPATTVTVRQTGKDMLTLQVNGKTDASTTGDMSTQLMLGHAPLLLHSNPETVCVIGLASGITLGAVQTHPVLAVDCLEISPTVVEASSFFAPYNHNALEDSRLNLIVGDGRNHLALTGSRYDIITSEPSNPWISGIASLFTREFFELCRTRLNPGGLACIWVQAYNMSSENFRTIVRTYAEVFPNCAILDTGDSSDYLLIGGDSFQVDMERIRKALSRSSVAQDLSRIGINTPGVFMGRFLVGPQKVKEFAGTGRIHTDDNLLLEFSAPKNLKVKTRVPHIRRFLVHRESATNYLPRVQVDRYSNELARIFDAQKHVLNGLLAKYEGDLNGCLQELSLAVDKVPEDGWAKQMLGQAQRDAGKQMFEQGQYTEAVAWLAQSATHKPDDPNVFAYLGGALFRLQKLEEAAAAYQRAAELDPLSLEHPNNLGLVLSRMGESEQAIAIFRTVIKRDESFGAAYNNLGVQFYRDGDLPEARKAYEEGLANDPSYIRTYFNYGMLLTRQKELDKARIALRTFIDNWKGDPKLREDAVRELEKLN